VLYYTDCRFYQRILENSWIFIKNIEILSIQIIFRIPCFLFAFLIFKFFLHIFFLFYLSMVFTKNIKFLCYFIIWILYFIKKFEIFEIQNFNKIPSFTISFLFFLAFLAFCFLFHVPKLVQILWNFLWCFIGRVRYFTNDFWKILKVLLKKILICEIFDFSKFYSLLFVFLFSYYFWHFIFNFVYLYLSKKFRKFNFYFILLISYFIKEFWKIMECFSEKYRHLKSKILHKFHRLLFGFFYSFSVLIIFFFLFHLSKLVKKFYTFLWCFIVRIIDFIREFWKILEFLLKK